MMKARDKVDVVEWDLRVCWSEAKKIAGFYRWLRV